MKKISVLMATVFVDMLGFAIIFPLLPYYGLRLDADPWLIGWIIASFSIAQLAAAPLWGRFSDHYGRRPALLIGLTASAIAYVVFGLATSVWMLFLSRVVQGVGGGTTGVAQAYIGDAFEPKDRAKALGWLSAATSAGVMIGPAIGSLSIGLGYAAPGLIAATLCITNIAFAWRWLPESYPGKKRTADGAQDTMPTRKIRAVMWEVLRRPYKRLPRLIWIYTVGMLGFMSMAAVLALYLDARFGITEKTIGLFFLYIGALSVIMRAVVLGRLVDRFGETKVMRFGTVSLALGLALSPLQGSAVAFAAVSSLVPIGTACLFPSVSALVTRLAPKSELGQVLGVQQSFGGVARVFAPIWATAVFQGIGIATPFFVSAAVVGLVTFLALGVPIKVEPAGAVEAA